MRRLYVGPEDDDDGRLAVEVFCGERLMLRDDKTGEWSFPASPRFHTETYSQFVRKWEKDTTFRHAAVHRAISTQFKTKNGDDDGFSASFKGNFPCAALVYVYGSSIVDSYWRSFVPIYLSVRRIKGNYT